MPPDSPTGAKKGDKQLVGPLVDPSVAELPVFSRSTTMDAEPPRGSSCYGPILPCLLRCVERLVRALDEDPLSLPSIGMWVATPQLTVTGPIGGTSSRISRRTSSAIFLHGSPSRSRGAVA